MAVKVKTELATPLTLEPNQGIRVASGRESAVAYNDSRKNKRHYRDIPNDDSNEGLIKWANLPSIEETDGTYMIAVSMFDYFYSGTGQQAQIASYAINELANQKKEYELKEDVKVFPIAGTVNIEGPRVVFRKLVWVNSYDLLLGTAAQEVAIKAKLKKEQEDLINNDIANAKLSLNPSDTSFNKTIIIIAFVFVILLAIFFITKKKKDETLKAVQSQSPPVNIVRIPQKV